VRRRLTRRKHGNPTKIQPVDSVAPGLHTCAKEKHPMIPFQFYPEYDVLANLEVPDMVLTVTQEACVFNVSLP
jgi:hypothetical protein